MTRNKLSLVLKLCVYLQAILEVIPTCTHSKIVSFLIIKYIISRLSNIILVGTVL